MEITNKRLCAFLAEMVAFIAVLAFGLFKGHEYPQVFFWGIMTVLVLLILIVIGLSLKEMLSLLGAMVLMAVGCELLDKFVIPQFFKLGYGIGKIAEFIMMAAVFIPTFAYFIKLCERGIKRQKESNK